MRRFYAPLFLAVLAVGLFLPAAAFADSYEVKALSFDSSTLGLTGTADFKILSLSRTLCSANGASRTLAGSDFTSGWRGLTSNDGFAGTASRTDVFVWGVGSVELTDITSTVHGSGDAAAIDATTDAITSTPEPDTLLLLAAGLGVLAIAISKAV